MAMTATVIQHALRSLSENRAERGRHPLVPAAVRVERSRLRTRRGEVGDQTALTLWFGEGPALPGPSGTSRAARIVARAALAVVGAAAIGAVGVLASHEAERLAARTEAPRIAG